MEADRLRGRRRRPLQSRRVRMSLGVDHVGAIYLIGEDGGLSELQERAYDSELLLQSLLADYPNLLAGDQIDSVSPRRWLLVAREMGLPGEETGGDRWSVDHLFLDQEAIPTIVEVKRSTDTRIRREVVGQMLDYAANGVVYWPVEILRARFEATAQGRGEAPADVLMRFLDPDSDPEAFWQDVKINLQVGRVRLLFVADVIPPELQRVVEFLNTQMDPAEVLAVEIRQFADERLRTLVPRVMGQTSEGQVHHGRTRQRRQWDRESFLAEVRSKENGEQLAALSLLLMEWAEQHMDRMTWGRGLKDGSFIPIIDAHDTWYSLFAVYTSNRVELQFGYLRGKPNFGDEKLVEFLDKLNAIPGITLPKDRVFLFPTLNLLTLQDEAVREAVLDVMEWAVAEIRRDGSADEGALGPASPNTEIQ